MNRLRLLVVLLVAGSVLAALPLPAQTVESLALPDLFDSRATQDRLTARLAELTREEALQRSLNNHTLANQVAAAVTLLQNQRTGTVPIPPSAAIELHAVSFYEGAQGTPRTARVQLTRTATPVILLLDAYEPITWTLDPLPPGTVLLAVLALSYHPQVIQGVPSGVPVIQLDQNSGGTYFGRPDLEGRGDLSLWCFSKLGLFPSTFQGTYTAPSGPFEVGPGATEWRDQWVLGAALVQGQNFNHGTRANLAARFGPQAFFPLLTPAMRSSGASQLVLANPYGPLSPPYARLNSISTYDVGAGNVFVLHNRTPSILNLGTLTPTAIPPDPTLPPFSWVNGLAFDQVRNRLLVSGFGGVGHLYAWDLATFRWSLVNTLNNVDLGAIAHHPVLDAIFALDTGAFGGGPFRLRRYDQAGALVSTVTLGLWTWGAPVDSFQMFVLGPNLAVVGPARSLLGAPVRHVFVIDPGTGDIVFASYWIG